MMTQNTHHYYLIAVAQAAPSIRNLFMAAWGIEGIRMLRQPLVPISNPALPAKYFAAEFLTTDDVRSCLELLESDGLVSSSQGVFYVRFDAVDDPTQGMVQGTIRGSNFPNSASWVGTQFDKLAVLQSIGLKEY